MKIIITMAGQGNRFKQIGILKNKQDIIARGRTLFTWSMLSLQAFFCDDFIFIAHHDRVNKNTLEKQCSELGIRHYNLICINQDTDGQAQTALFADPYIKSSYPCIIYNIDTYLHSNELSDRDIKDSMRGFIPLFHSSEERLSFAKIENNHITDIAEKKNISSLATVGLYYFSSWQLYKEAYYQTYQTPSKEEKYIAPMYQYMIQNGQEIGYKIIHKLDILGTHEDLMKFDYSYINNN